MNVVSGCNKMRVKMEYWKMIWFWEIVGNAIGANESTRFSRHQSRLATIVSYRDEELEVQIKKFESSDEQYNINVMELRSEDEENADVI